MGKLPGRLNRLAKQLGVPTPEDVIKLFEEDSSAAADVLVDVLDTMIKSINANSRSGVLSGYKAVKEPVGVTRIRLAKSGIDLSGNYEWIVYVKAPSDHAGAKTNVFDIIDEGRPELPYREKPYALWAAALRKQPGSKSVRTRKPFPTNARVTQSGDRVAGNYPLAASRVSASRQGRGKGERGTPMVFSRGPLALIPAKLLYERALTRAKDRLSVKGLSQYFDVVLIAREKFVRD